jgi:hypothetical protein
MTDPSRPTSPPARIVITAVGHSRSSSM